MLALAAGSTTSLLRPCSALDAAITFGAVAAAGIASVLLVAGTAGRLTAGAVLLLEGVWALAAFGLAMRTGMPRPRLRRPRIRAALDHPWQAAVVTLSVLALTWQLLVALVLPPFAFDALTYHLTIVATWVQAENLDPTPLSLCCAYYPANSELMFAWPVVLLGADTVVDTVQIGFAVLGALSVAGIARSCGLPPPTAAASAALFVVTPIVLVQAPTNYADVTVAACSLAALHALARFAVTGAWPRLVVAGLAAGLVLGTKGTGIVWATVLTLSALVLVTVLWRRGRISARIAVGGMAAFSAACLALGSYWYVRNWIDTGNPVYPFRVQAVGSTLFDGPLRLGDVLTEPEVGRDQPWPVAVARSWVADLDFWRQGSYDYQQRAGGLGPLWPWLALPLIVPSAALLVRRRMKGPALVTLTSVGLVLLVQPYRWWSRFTIPLAALGAVAIAVAAHWAPCPWMRHAVRLGALGLAAAGVALSSFEIDPAARARPLRADELIGLIGGPNEERTVGRLFFPEYRFLERVPEDTTVIVDLRAEPVRFVYPMFGSRYTRAVLPARSHRPLREAWVVTSAMRPLDRALRADPGFRLVSATRGVRVWKPAR